MKIYQSLKYTVSVINISATETRYYILNSIQPLLLLVAPRDVKMLCNKSRSINWSINNICNTKHRFTPNINKITIITIQIIQFNCMKHEKSQT